MSQSNRPLRKRKNEKTYVYVHKNKLFQFDIQYHLSNEILLSRTEL